ncbi:TIGR03899 family protein [Paraglaciecola sp. L3A3]|uniref:TIGR03899 family protein n=1 Tax=Paraglaciecola sp. L3A3 TaxID=2686358 RepID=UPI00131B618F|nr:TIGR03899 family protein [Paraglaciecola sp. L3A3]
MKIEPQSTSRLVKSQIPSSLDKTKNKSASASHKNAAQLSNQSNQNRISQWFAQVGVQTGYSVEYNLTLNQKAKLKAQMLARRKFENLQNILGKALDFCLDDGHGELIDPDWFFSFVNMAEEIYSPAMQQLWGKIFAVETATPGSFSLKTLEVLKQLTHKDALIFKQAVNLASKRKGEASPKLLLGFTQRAGVWSLFSKNKTLQVNLAEFGLGYPDLLSLMDLGLLHQSEIESAEIVINIPEQWYCAGHGINLQAKKTGTTLIYYKFTNIGAELFKLVTRKKQVEYVNALKGALTHSFSIN